MTILKLALAVLSLIAIILTFRTNNKITNIILAGMFAGIILVQFPSEEMTVAGIKIYMVFVLAVFFYGVIIKGKKIVPRMIIIVMAASMFAYWLWTLNHWHGNTVLLPVLAFLTGILTFFRIKELKPELGFLIILWIDALDSMVEHLLKSL